MSPLIKKIVWFVAVFVVVWGGLVALRGKLSPAYEYLFRAGGNFAFNGYLTWRDGSVRFIDLDQSPLDLRNDVDLNTYGTLPANKVILRPLGKFDTLMLLRNRSRMGNFGMLRTSARLVGYSPTVLIVALFLATPTTWRRRLIGLLAGLLFVHAYIFVRLAIDLATGEWGFASAQPYALFKLSDFWSGVLTRVSEVVAENPTVYLAVLAFFWLAFILLSGTLASIVQESKAEPEAIESSD